MFVRNLVIVIVAISVGVAGGVVFTQVRLGGQLQAVATERDAFAVKQATLDRELADLKSRAQGLEDENKRLREQSGQAVAPPREPALESVAEPPVDMSGPPSPDDAATDRRDRRGNPDEATSPEDQERQEQRREERDQRMADFRDRMSQFFTGEMQKTNDAAVQQRLSQLNEYAQYTMDLRTQMRDAKTDEERQALSDQLEQASTTTRTLVKDQQDYLLRQSLSTNGVSDAATQEALINSLRGTMESPFFRMPMGGGGGPWGGGRGGPRGGGQ